MNLSLGFERDELRGRAEAMPPTAAEARSVPRLSTARKRTPVLPSAEPALPTSKAARLSSAMTARYGRYSGASAARGVPRQSVAPRDSMAHPVRASPILYDDHDGMRALRNVAENLLTTLTLQAFLRWKGGRPRSPRRPRPRASFAI